MWKRGRSQKTAVTPYQEELPFNTQQYIINFHYLFFHILYDAADTAAAEL